MSVHTYFSLSSFNHSTVQQNTIRTGLIEIQESRKKLGLFTRWHFLWCAARWQNCHQAIARWHCDTDA